MVLHMLSLVILMVEYCDARTTEYCPPFHNSGPINKTKDLSDYAFVYETELLKLYCCVSGKDVTIKWLFWPSNNTEGWIISNNTYHNNNQTLVIKTPDMQSDQGTYKCIAQNKQGGSFQHSIILKIYPSAFDGAPDTTKGTVSHNRLPGEEITFECLGFFGRSSFIKDISWLRNKTTQDTTHEHRLLNVTDKYRIYKIDRKHSTMTSFLTILNINSSDYGEYECWLANGVGTTRKKYILQFGVKNDTKIETQWLLIVYIGVSSAFVLLVIVLMAGTLIARRKKWNIYLSASNAWKDHFGRHEKCTGEMSTDNVDVAIICGSSDEDRRFAITVMEELERISTDKKYYYTCKMEIRDFLPGTVRINEYGKMVEYSKRVIFIITSAILQTSAEQECELSLQVAVDRNKKVIFIEHSSVSDSGHEGGEDEEMVTLKRFMKYYNVIKWDDSDPKKSERSHKLLKSYLPRAQRASPNTSTASNHVDSQPRTKVTTSTSSSRPLMSSVCDDNIAVVVTKPADDDLQTSTANGLESQNDDVFQDNKVISNDMRISIHDDPKRSQRQVSTDSGIATAAIQSTESPRFP